MKKIRIFFLAGILLTLPIVTFAKQSITCPTRLTYSCVTDASCPQTRCTLISRAAAAWIFLAPYKPLQHINERTSCSILPEGEYEADYLASIYGPAEGIGDIAYCMYITVTNSFSVSALYSPDYKKGKGNWQKPDPTSPSYACIGAADCEFDLHKQKQ